MNGPKPIEFEAYTPEEDFVVVTLPTKFAVCSRCDGTGVHDNPAFSDGITPEQFDEDPDFKEAYFSGRYDVRCEVCDGLRVESVPDEERCEPWKIKAYHEHLDGIRSCLAEMEAERRMGA